MEQTFLHLILAWPTIVYTVLLALIVLYWLFMTVGVLGADSIEPDLDLDLDADLDIEVDADLEMEVDADLDGNAGELADSLSSGKRRWYPFKSLLVWLNVGRVPLLFLLSIAIIIAWSCSALLCHNQLAGPLSTFFISGFTGALAAKFMTWPFIPLFRRMSQDAKDVDYIGTTGKIILPANQQQFGQMEVRYEDDFLLVYVKPAPGQESLTAGSRAVIIGKTDDQRYYLAEPERPPY
ncbi:MAG: hypothetical protein AAF828_02610 [Bacteroidota bacterium]